MTEIPEDVAETVRGYMRELQRELGRSIDTGVPAERPLVPEYMASAILAEREAQRERDAKIAERRVQHISEDGDKLLGVRDLSAAEIAAAIRTPA